MNIYQLKVTLRHIKPPIWRRIQVRGNTQLNELHEILQDVMGWTDAHLHAFRIGNENYGVPDPQFNVSMRNESNVQFNKIAGPGDKFIYAYDFGDGWEHEIEIEKILDEEPDAIYPRCLAGARACPPEDCGGPHGYLNLLKIYNDPANEEHEDICEWLGEDFDPDYFSNADVNAMLCPDELRLAALFADDSSLDDTIPQFSDTELAACEPLELFDLLIVHADRVPRNVIDACAHHGEAMLSLLSAWSFPDRTLDDATPGLWWLRLHAVMILGLMPGDPAGTLLVEYVDGMCNDEDHDFQEWFAGYWPALFRNKPRNNIESLRAIVENKTIDWFMRVNMLETVLAAAQRDGVDELDTALDWIAQFAADATENEDMRLIAAGYLLEFPRARHRPLLETLVPIQQDFGRHFGTKEIDAAFARGTDQPGWERFDNPWQFYAPQEIEKRQQRWREEDAAEADAAYDFDDVLDDEYQETYVRDLPKIGRNDPCPCGSGRKYKKCCLGKIGNEY